MFVLTILHQMDEEPKNVSGLVLCNTRELAYQIKNEFARFQKYMPKIRTEVIYGGEPIGEQIKLLQGPNCPHVIVGTPGRILALVKKGVLKFENLKHFVLDECDKMLEVVGTLLPHAVHLTSFFRHEIRHPEDLQRDSTRQAGHDVLSHHERRRQEDLQNVHEEPVRALYRQ